MISLLRRYMIFAICLTFICAVVHGQDDHPTNQLRTVIDEKSSVHKADDPRHQRRQLFDFWSLLFLLTANDHPCPPIGPPHDRCVQAKQDDASSSSSTSSSSSSSSVQESASSKDYTNSVPESGVTGARMKPLSWMMLAAAFVAMAFAIGAMMWGQRGPPVPHPLKGSVTRRKNLFQSFVDCAICGDETTRGGNPNRHLEMTISKDDYDRVSV